MTDAHSAQRGEHCREEADEVILARVCAWPGCCRPGDYRAPKSRDALRDFLWFCLEHVRAYNANWNYFAGLDAGQIETIRHRDATWHRPTWPLGTRACAHEAVKAAMNGFADPFEVGSDAPPAGPPVSPERAKALESLGLECDASDEQVKARYKTLAKRHHPDANGGCTSAEERLKEINEAYTFLRNGEET